MLNRVTIFDAEPMSNPEQIFSSLTSDVLFSKVDCSKGYWQIAMNHSDIEKTAFSTPSGLFQFRRMPFVSERWRVILSHDEETVI